VKREPHVPQGTIALLAVYLLIIIFLWSNVYFTMRSRGVNTPTGSLTAPSSTSLVIQSDVDFATLKGFAL